MVTISPHATRCGSRARLRLGMHALLAGWVCACAPAAPVRLEGEPERFATGVASTPYAEIRLTLSPDGRTALWFSRDRPGGPGGYDIWMSRRRDGGWSTAAPVTFNSAGRDFDPAFSADGRYVYFCSDRAGGRGGDDIWRVAVDGEGFGTPERLAAPINSDADEFAPMPAHDGRRLLFSSDRGGGAGGHDLYVAAWRQGEAPAVAALPGAINTAANEFDGSFLSDGRTLVFARAMDFRTDQVLLYVAALRDRGYDAGTALPRPVNGDGDAYGPMLDWSQPGRFTFSATHGADGSAPANMDLFVVPYRLDARTTDADD